MQSYDFIIVGAGPAGLTCAHQLLKAGKSVLLVERDARVGGLAKSHTHQGHIFDTGPKRFHTDDPKVLDFIHAVMADELLIIGRSTKVYFQERYFQWPLTTQDVLRLPPLTALKCFKDLFDREPVEDRQSFSQFIKAKYGNTLYDLFFKPYTEKFLRWPAQDIHADWATTGINRTVVDKRVKANTSFDIFKSLLLPAKIETKFLYPSVGGFGGFYDKLHQQCCSMGLTIKLSSQIEALTSLPDRIKARLTDGQEAEARALVWSGNINDLGQLTKAIPGQLNYLNTIFYNMVCRQEGVSKEEAQWIYVSKGDSLVSRITCMKQFAPYTCPVGYSNLVCELTDAQAKPQYFLNPKAHTQAMIEELVRMRFIKGAQYIEQVFVNPVRDTYPIYHRHYHEDFARRAGAIKAFSSRIHLLGRSGAFWYNNSDHSIRFALELAAKLLEGNILKSFDYRHYFGGLPCEGH